MAQSLLLLYVIPLLLHLRWAQLGQLSARGLSAGDQLDVEEVVPDYRGCHALDDDHVAVVPYQSLQESELRLVQVRVPFFPLSLESFR